MSMFSLLISLFAVVFWALRVAVAFTASMGIEFMLQPLNLPMEIILTFVTFICIIFIFRRKLIGAIGYLISNLGYYGVYLYNMLLATEEIVVIDYLNIIVSIVGILLPLIIFIDIGLSQSAKKTSSKTKNTDWYYQNEDYDRKFDDRVDRNQYKF